MMKNAKTIIPDTNILLHYPPIEQIDWLIEETLDLFGKIDILVTNAGGPPSGNFNDIEESDWMKAVQLTLMSTVRLTKAVIPGMRKQKWGRIIHLTSVSVKQPIEGFPGRQAPCGYFPVV